MQRNVFVFSRIIPKNKENSPQPTQETVKSGKVLIESENFRLLIFPNDRKISHFLGYIRRENAACEKKRKRRQWRRRKNIRKTSTATMTMPAEQQQQRISFFGCCASSLPQNRLDKNKKRKSDNANCRYFFYWNWKYIDMRSETVERWTRQTRFLCLSQIELIRNLCAFGALKVCSQCVYETETQAKSMEKRMKKNWIYSWFYLKISRILFFCRSTYSWEIL